MSLSDVVSTASFIALAMLSVALLLALVRLIRGPSLPDRVVALDLMIDFGCRHHGRLCHCRGTTRFSGCSPRRRFDFVSRNSGLRALSREAGFQ